jgi:hypothetical protein
LKEPEETDYEDPGNEVRDHVRITNAANLNALKVHYIINTIPPRQ